MNLYPWLVYLHIAGAFLFVMAHGVSALTAFRLRAERDPARMSLLLNLSSMSLGAMYVGLLVLLVAGVVAAIVGDWLRMLWPWVAIGVLVLVAIGMYVLGTRYYAAVRQALGMPSMNDRKGEPPPSARPIEEVVRLLDTRRPEQIAAFGTGGLLILLWLMVMKPF
jgi:hypothetical protein